MPDFQRRTWAWASTGALSDALSTSFMLMPLKRIGKICQAYPGFGVLVMDPKEAQPVYAFGQALQFG